MDLAPLTDRLERANRALGRLDGISTLLPDPSTFLYIYVRKEAVLSSQIEGTQSSLSDLLTWESAQAPGVPLQDVQEVSSYVKALERGLLLLRRKQLPISSRLIREVHQVLLEGGRGADKGPGDFRRQHVWLGGRGPWEAAFVPPPPQEVSECMSALERFIHDEAVRTPTLIKAALAHAQFETIHPFMDGNGRVGRMLISLILAAEEALHEPLLYLSLFFKTHRDRYYELLQQTRTSGDWEAWLEFFLSGVEETANQAHAMARGALELFAADRQKLRAELKRDAHSALNAHDHLQKKPVVTAKVLSQATRMSLPTALKALSSLERTGVVRELSGKKRGKLFAYAQFLALLDRGLG